MKRKALGDRGFFGRVMKRLCYNGDIKEGCVPEWRKLMEGMMDGDEAAHIDNDINSGAGDVVATRPETIPGETPAMKKNKRVLGWKIATGALGAAVLGMAGFLTYHFVATNHEVKQCEETTCEIVETKDEITGETVKVIKVPVGNSDDDVAVREVVDKMYGMAVEILPHDKKYAMRTYNEAFVIYRSNDWKSATDLSLTYGFEVSSSISPSWKTVETLISALTNELLQRGFQEYQLKTMGSKEYINEQTGIICSVGEASLPYTFGCSSVNWYDAENVELINDLAEAYKKQEGDYPHFIATSESAVEDSGYERYQRLMVNLYGAAGWFYRVSPESEWVFFRGAQDAIPCSDFNTDDLRRAFVGVGCRNEKTQMDETVKL